MLTSPMYSKTQSAQREESLIYLLYLQTPNTSAGILTLFHCWVIHRRAVSNFPLQYKTSLSDLTSLMSQSRCWKLYFPFSRDGLLSVSGLCPPPPSATSAFYCCPLKWLAFLLWHLQALRFLCPCCTDKMQQNIVLQLKKEWKHTHIGSFFFWRVLCFEGIKKFYFTNYQLLGGI